MGAAVVPDMAVPHVRGVRRTHTERPLGEMPNRPPSRRRTRRAAHDERAITDAVIADISRQGRDGGRTPVPAIAGIVLAVRPACDRSARQPNGLRGMLTGIGY